MRSFFNWLGRRTYTQMLVAFLGMYALRRAVAERNAWLGVIIFVLSVAEFVETSKRDNHNQQERT